MKYNIITTCNESYFLFLKVFLNSAWENLDFSKINQIYIFDTGLNEEQKEWVKCFKNISLIPTDLDIKSSKVHDEKWEKITYSKVKYLQYILEKDKILSFMIDSDSVFNSEFIDLIDKQKSFFLCDLDRVGIGSLCECPLIGSFYGINPNECDYEQFLKTWNDEIINEKRLAWKESPALYRTYTKYKNIYQIQLLRESIISHTYYSPKSGVYPRILHLKSEKISTGEIYNSVEKRLTFDYAKDLVKRYK